MPVLYAIVVAVSLAVKNKYARDRKKALIGYAVFAVFAVALSALTVTLLKSVMCRERYLTALGAGYTPWYRKGAGGDSFPSGHAAMSFFILLVPDFIKSVCGKKSVFCAVLGVIFIVSVCASRMLEGAHYFSDLVFGAGISFFITAVTRSVTDAVGITPPRRSCSKKSVNRFATEPQNIDTDNGSGVK